MLGTRVRLGCGVDHIGSGAKHIVGDPSEGTRVVCLDVVIMVETLVEVA